MRINGLFRRNPERGGSAVEFAIVMPIFCAILFGIIDFGWYFYQKFTLAAAIRDGIRYGVTFSYSSGSAANEAAKRAADALAAGGAIAKADAPMTAAVTGAPPSATLTLSSQYTFKPLVGFVKLPSTTMKYGMTMLLEIQR